MYEGYIFHLVILAIRKAISFQIFCVKIRKHEAREFSNLKELLRKLITNMIVPND